MAYGQSIRDKAAKFRRQGRSVKRVAIDLGIAVSTASLWLRGASLPEAARKKLARNIVDGRAKGRRVLRERRRREWEADLADARKTLRSSFRGRPADWRSMAAILYWCEGGKRSNHHIQFANSDPGLIAVFLEALRRGFGLEEKKLRALVHLHEYHDRSRQLRFWSGVTGIPPAQFNRPYIKPNTGKRKRADYPGCLSVRYGDSRLARKLKAIYHIFAQSYVKE